MAIPNNKYWQSRFEQLHNAQINKSDDFFKRVEEMYRRSIADIEKDTARWYMRLAANNDISLREAKKLLKKDELEEFKWTLNQYIKKAKENGISADWSRQLENASAKFHISRLDALKLQMQQHLEYLYGNYLDGMYEAMRNTYQDSFYNTAYELQKGFKTGFEVAKIDTKSLEKILSKPWAADELNFSDRLWRDKTKLINTLQNELVQSLIRGTPQDKIVKSFADKMNVSLSQAGRLISTETAYFATLAEKDSMEKLGTKQYEILATLDRRTSDICRHLDGKVFNVSDFQAGITAPPFHCWCRSCTIPHIKKLSGSRRAARGDDGKTYYIDGNMKYNDWKQVFVDKSMTIDEWRKQQKKSMYKIVEGHAVADKWKRRKEQFPNQIDDVIDYQGFNGLPQVIDNEDDFWKKVADDHFIGNRVYTAKTQEELEKYADDLRYGKWYVDCHVGGAQYGKGMYCAADYTKGNLRNELSQEMKYYAEWGKRNGKPFSKIEVITLDKTAKIFVIPNKEHVSKLDLIYEVAKQYVKKYPAWFNLNENYTENQYNKTVEAYANKIARNRYDLGSMIALLGYDAINAAGHGATKSYTVVLNRTKLIILEGVVDED